MSRLFYFAERRAKERNLYQKIKTNGRRLMSKLIKMSGLSIHLFGKRTMRGKIEKINGLFFYG